MFNQIPMLEYPKPKGDTPSSEPLRIVQSMAIVRHLARMHGMYGESTVEATRCDELLEGARDLIRPCLMLAIVPNRKESLEEIKYHIAPRYLRFLEHALARN